MLTTRQRDVLLYVQSYTRDHGGVSPSIKEIMGEFGWRSRCMPSHVLKQLEARGHIRRLHYRARAIEVLKPINRYRVFAYIRDIEKFEFVGESP